MLEFDGGQAQCTNTFPNWPTLGGPVVQPPEVPPVAAVLGPTMQGTGVLVSIFNNLCDLNLAYRDRQAGGGIAWRDRLTIHGLYPGSYIFPSAIGFRAQNHNAGQTVELIGQVWETVDGPLPTTPLSPNSGFLTPGGVILPFGRQITNSDFAGGPPTATANPGDIWIGTNVNGSGNGTWMFTYNPAESPSSPWVFIGGTPIQLLSVAALTVANAWTTFPTNGSYTFMRAGGYNFDGGWFGVGNAGGVGTYECGWGLNGTIFAGTGITTTNAAWDFTVPSIPWNGSFAVGATLDFMYWCSVLPQGNSTWSWRLWPISIS